jgi:integrase/recombinase XerD
VAVRSVRLPNVNLTKYVNLDGQWRFCPVVYSGNGRIKPDQVLVNGKPETHTEGAYYIEWYDNGKRKRRSVGKNALDAFAAQKRQAQVLGAKAHGITVSEGDPTSPTLGEACEEFLREIELHRKHKTFLQYSTALTYLKESVGERKRLADVSRKDLLNFVQYIRQEKNLAERTAWTKLTVAVQLLKSNGIRGLLARKDWPRFVQTEPEVYSPEQIQKLLATCDDFRRTLFEFFWMTGFREQEVQRVTWSDVDFTAQVVRVVAKPDWRPKTWEEREVPMSDRLVQSLQYYRRVANTKTPYVFSTSTGQVCYHFLDMLKKTALEAGLNCGLCDNGTNICAVSPVCDRWYLHKFRATFATMLLQNTDLATVQRYLGHKDLASTMRYLRPARGSTARAKVNDTFAPFV